MRPPTTETSTTSTLRAPLLPAFVLILLQIAIPLACAAAPSPVTDHLGVATLATPVALLRRGIALRTTQPEMPHVSAPKLATAPYAANYIGAETRERDAHDVGVKDGRIESRFARVRVLTGRARMRVEYVGGFSGVCASPVRAENLFSVLYVNDSVSLV